MPTLHDDLIQGTGLSDDLAGGAGADTMVGLSGDDSLAGDSGNDLIYGDYSEANLFGDAGAALSFADYAALGAWQATTQASGHQQISQSVSTEAGGVYEMTFSMAANFAGGHVDAGIEILVNGVVVETVTSQSGVFSDHTVTFTASDDSSEITLRAVDGGGSGPDIDTSGAVFTTPVKAHGRGSRWSSFASRSDFCCCNPMSANRLCWPQPLSSRSSCQGCPGDGR